MTLSNSAKMHIFAVSLVLFTFLIFKFKIFPSETKNFNQIQIHRTTKSFDLEIEQLENSITNCSIILGEKQQFKFLPLLSLPGSGNTWLRFLIESSTGFATGSVYQDARLSRDLIGEMREVKNFGTIVQKTHTINGFKKVTGLNDRPPMSLPPEKLSLEDRKKINLAGCILLLRDPKDAILAEYNRLSLKNHSGTIDYNQIFTDLLIDKRENQIDEDSKIPKNSKNSIWKQKSTELAKKFNKIYFQAINFCHRYHLQPHYIIYENLKKSKAELIKIMNETVNFLNQQYRIANQIYDDPDNENFSSSKNEKLFQFRSECLENNSEGEFHRKSSTVRTWEVAQFLSKEAIDLINRAVGRLNVSYLGGRLPACYRIDTEQ